MFSLRNWCAPVAALLLTATVSANPTYPQDTIWRYRMAFNLSLIALIGTLSWPFQICPAARSFINFFKLWCNPPASDPKST